jgi:hypothetical protein
MLQMWKGWEAFGTLQEEYEDLTRINQSMQSINLPQNRRPEIHRMVASYRLGQLKGLYWLWRIESLGHLNPNLIERVRLLDEALTRKIPRWEPDYKGELQKP